MAIWFGGNFGGKMRGDALDIFHERYRLLENIAVDALENVAGTLAAMIEANAISVVDVAAAVNFRADKFTGNLKLPDDGGQIRFRFFAHSRRVGRNRKVGRDELVKHRRKNKHPALAVKSHGGERGLRLGQFRAKIHAQFSAGF